ncbi:MAG: 2-oxoacid:acceptor oxidoreductase family protein [Oscillospiraceae bacterium]|nr:2-oxoacid:acceptor oxidoreductase family protein [Oscillospiraceae bacterium]
MSIFKMFFAGSGGQGVLLMGQMVTYAAMLEDKSSTFFPSYGPEMRGGTANCTVVVSDKTVSCPVIYESDCVVAMNLPSMVKFEPTLKPGGILLLNKSIIHQEPKRSDITIFNVPVNEMAHELGNPRVANMIMLGAFVRTTGIVSEDTVETVIKETFSGAKAKLADINLKAFNYWKEGITNEL